MAMFLECIGQTILCLFCLLIVLLLVYALIIFGISAAKVIKKEVQDNERNGIK